MKLELSTKFFLLLTFLFLFTVFLIQFSTAQSTCVNLKLAKSSYLPQETVQVEIDTNTIKDVTKDDLFLFRKEGDEEVRLPTVFFLSKISKSKFFVWFDLPDKPGDYEFKARGSCEGGLKINQVSFKVKIPIASLYKTFEDKASDLRFFSLEENIISASSLINSGLYNSIFEKMLERNDNCFEQECSTKLNSLTLIATKDTLRKQELLDKLTASQNTIKGDWVLKIISQPQTNCNLSINNKTETLNFQTSTTFNLNPSLNELSDSPNIQISLTCNQDVEAAIDYSYKNINKELTMDQQGSTLTFSLDNSGCFGSGFKTQCDSEQTSYALLALKKTNNLNLNSNNTNTALDWLTENSKSIKDRAVNYYLNQNDLDYLLSTQNLEGYWPTQSFEADKETTSIVTFVLKNSLNQLDINNSQSRTKIISAIEKSEDWIKEQFSSSNFYEKGFFLTFSFQSSEIEPILQFWPGLVKTESQGTFNLILRNKGKKDINVIANLLKTQVNITLPENTIKNIQFTIPKATTLDGRAILRNLLLFYNPDVKIPVVIFTEKGLVEQIGDEVIISEDKLEEAEREQIIREIEIIDRTTTFDELLLQQGFTFIEREITKNITTEKSTLTLRLTNYLDQRIKDITITHTGLSFVIDKISPTLIDSLEKNEIRQIRITLNPLTSGTYDGSIKAEGTYKNQKVSTHIPLTINVARTEEKTCSELDGSICEENEVCEGDTVEAADTFYCCIGVCKSKGAAGRSLALVIIALVVLVLVIIVVLVKRKPKKEMKTFLEQASKEYERKFQRPASIR